MQAPICMSMENRKPKKKDVSDVVRLFSFGCSRKGTKREESGRFISRGVRSRCSLFFFLFLVVSQREQPNSFHDLTDGTFVS